MSSTRGIHLVSSNPPLKLIQTEVHPSHCHLGFLLTYTMEYSTAICNLAETQNRGIIILKMGPFLSFHNNKMKNKLPQHFLCQHIFSFREF